MYGGGTIAEVGNEEKPTLLQKYRQEKFVMVWEAYERFAGEDTTTALSEFPVAAMQPMVIADDILDNWPANSGAPA